MTTYLGEKAVGIGTVKANMNVGKVITDDKTILGDGFTEPLAVNTLLFATSESVAASAEAVRTEFNNKLKVVDSAIDGQADAIAKTRNDFEVADQEIRADMNEKDAELEHMITEHAEELTTLRGNQASLGDQVSGIEEKIPESASGSNPLVTKQQLLDEEMDIRDDLNESVSELQSQITAQAGAIATKQDKLIAGENITIEDGVISATGGGASGDYLPLSGGTLSGIFSSVAPALTISSNETDVYAIVIRQKNGYGVRFIANGAGGFFIDPISASTKYLFFGRMMYNNSTSKLSNVKILNNGADIAIPTTGGTMALKEDIDAAVGDISTALTAILGE